jgi:hypothetical protein
MSDPDVLLGAVLCELHWSMVVNMFDDVGQMKTLVDDAEAVANGEPIPDRTVTILYESWTGWHGPCEAGLDATTDVPPCSLPGSRRCIRRGDSLKDGSVDPLRRR